MADVDAGRGGQYHFEMKSTNPAILDVVPAPQSYLASRTGHVTIDLLAQELGEIFEKLRPYLRARAHEHLDPQLRVKVRSSDVVQETLLEAHRGFSDFHGRSRAELVVWVQGVLNHRIQTAYRKYRGTGKRDLSREVRLHESEGSEQKIQLEANQCSPSAQAIVGEEFSQLEKALQSLPSRYEQVIRLQNELGLSFHEVGIAGNQ